MLKRRGSAHWSGTLKEGAGSVSTQSGAVGAPYSFARRFGDAPGTNPEELIGAAHAACYAMALSATLGEAGLTASAIDATATVSLDLDGVPTVRTIHLEVSASIQGIEDARFQKLAAQTKENCPISRLLAAAEISLTARLV